MAGDLRSRILGAALKRLADGDHLDGFGLSKQGLADAIGEHRTSVQRRFGPGDSAIAREVVEWGCHEVDRVAAGNVRDYQLLSKSLEDGADPRKVIRRALIGDLGNYFHPESEEGVAMQRAYFLAVALADRPAVEGLPDYGQLLARTQSVTQERYGAVYDAFLTHFGRTPVNGRESLQRMVNALLEGVIVHERIGLPVDLDEIVDAVLALFYVMSRPIDEDAIDVEAELFRAGEDAHEEPRRRDRVRAMHGSDAVYDVACDALERVRMRKPPDVIRHASLHGHAGSQRFDDHANPDRLRGVIVAMLENGWRLRRYVGIRSREHLNEELNAMTKLLTSFSVELRGARLHRGAQLVPLIAGSDLALLGVDEPFRNVPHRALMLEGQASTGVCIEHFDQLWDAAPTRRLMGPHGVDEAGIEAMVADLNE